MPQGRLPNIIVIMADDLGYGDIGAYGNPYIRTPHLDRLAAEGLRLTQHYSASPMCAPARAAFLTGRYNHRVGAVDVPSNRGLDRIDLGVPTMADFLRRRGYTTGMVGKWHNGLHDMRYHPNARGFDEFAGFLNGGMDYWHWCLDYNGRPERADGRYLTDVFTQEAVSFIERRRESPFFLYVAYNAPHLPLQAPEHLVSAYQQTGKLNKAVSIIYAMIETMDAGIGRILATLDRHCLTQNTLVLFTSDNGPMFLGKGEQATERYNSIFRGAKGDVLEGGIRVPAILRWPAGLPAGLSKNDVVHFTDWLPTFLAITGGSDACGQEKFCDGASLLPVLQGRAGHEFPERYWQWNRYTPVPFCNATVRQGEWKLYWPAIPEAMRKDPADKEPYRRGLTEGHWLAPLDTTLPARDIGPPQPPRLFNVHDDPGEKADVSMYYPERVAAMTRTWEDWFTKVENEWRTAYSSAIRPIP